MEIKKTVSAQGEVKITIDGKELSVELSRELTGTTRELIGARGIFAPVMGKFFFGEFNVDFAGVCCDFPALTETLTVQEYARRLLGRINFVRGWVEDCKATAGSVTVEDIATLTQRLHACGSLYYRNAKGQIQKLK